MTIRRILLILSLTIAVNTNATLTTSGEGVMTNVGDSISGVMFVDTIPVSYTLTLTAADIVGSIDWNGAGRASPSSFSWEDSSTNWTIELVLSSKVNLVVAQNGLSGLANEPTSMWTVNWDTSAQTSLVDPDNQLDDVFTSLGAGIAMFSSTTRVFNDEASWAVFGPDSMTYTITWQNLTMAGPGTDSIGFDELLSAAADTDADGISDGEDNCVNAANVMQIDTDNDGYGNTCDGDFNNDCIINFIDIAAFSNEFLGTNALFDLNSDGAVNFIDFASLSNMFLLPPGPGQGDC